MAKGKSSLAAAKLKAAKLRALAKKLPPLPTTVLASSSLPATVLRDRAKASTNAAAARMGEAMRRQGRALISSAPAALQPGDLVYRVVEYDPPEKALHTWKIVWRVVQRVSDTQILLQSYFPGDFRRQFHLDALGRAFHATPKLAIDAFADLQRREQDRIDHRRRETERALAWAYGQGATAVL